MADEFYKAGKDQVIPGVTKPFKLQSEHIRTLQDVGDISGADSFIGLRSLEELTPEHTITRDLDIAILKDKMQLNQLDEKLARAKNEGKKQKISAEMSDLEAKIAENERTSAVVFEIDGSMSALTNRKPIFQDGAREIVTLTDGRKSLKAEGMEFLVSKDGTIEISSTVVAPKNLASAASITVKPGDLLTSMNHTERSLTKALRQLGGEANVPLTAEVKNLRKSLPSTFTAFLREDGDVIFSLQKTAKHKVPVTLSRDDVYGLTERGGNLIAAPRKFINSTHDTFAELSYFQKTAV